MLLVVSTTRLALAASEHAGAASPKSDNGRHTEVRGVASDPALLNDSRSICNICPVALNSMKQTTYIYKSTLNDQIQYSELIISDRYCCLLSMRSLDIHGGLNWLTRGS